MHKLSYELTMNSMVIPTAKITFKGCRDVWVCNPMEEIANAIDMGEPFIAHAVVGMDPSEIIVNPAFVMLVER